VRVGGRELVGFGVGEANGSSVGMDVVVGFIGRMIGVEVVATVAVALAVVSGSIGTGVGRGVVVQETAVTQTKQIRIIQDNLLKGFAMPFLLLKEQNAKCFPFYCKASNHRICFIRICPPTCIRKGKRNIGS
jgi:hypothetical protein